MARTNSKFKAKNKHYGIDLGNSTTIEPSSPITPLSDDGAGYATTASSYFGATAINMDGNGGSDRDLLKRYRTMSTYSEVDMAIDNIVNEAVVYDGKNYPVSLNLDKLPLSKTVKMKIFEEFNNIMKLFEFDEKSYNMFRRWYVDGRIYYNVIIDPKHPENGIIELRPIDAMKIKLMKEIKKEKDPNGVDFIKQVEEYFLYSEAGFVAGNGQPQNSSVQGIKFNVDSILTANSGLIDEMTKQIISHLHKAIRPSNQLRMLEDAVVIYKITRAPERRIFYIDTGNLPKLKAEEHLRDCMNQYKNKTVYDGATGEVRDDKKFMTMLEDYWLPRREGGKGTQIDTLPGASAAFSDMVDVGYFQTLLMHSLSVPMSRLQSNTGFNMGRSSEISRDEVNFIKFIFRLQKRFSFLLMDALKVQLILKGIIGDDDWNYLKSNIVIDFLKDNYFEELKNNEILSTRIQAAESLMPYIGKFYSNEYVRKNIFLQTDEEIETEDARILAEFENPIYYPPTSSSDELAGGQDGGDGQATGQDTGQSPDTDTGKKSKGASGNIVKITLADLEHSMSKKMLDVQNGTTFAVTKNGRIVAQMTPVSESLNESYDVLKVSLIDSYENLLAVMAEGEILTLSEGSSTLVNIKKI
jgi:antitoxin (DNA-binding transcriptional repressor) of toxin-antitoxin stability system